MARIRVSAGKRPAGESAEVEGVGEAVVEEVATTSGMMADFDRLDAGQRACVLHDTGPMLVTAVAGAGKTTAIVHRIARLVRSGVPRERILAVTFSKKGAEEMSTRVDRLLGPSETRAVRTIHSLAYELVRVSVSDRYTLDVTGARYKSIVDKVTGFHGMRWDAADTTKILLFIGRCKARLLAPSDDGTADIALALVARDDEAALYVEAYKRAEEAREAAGLLTFDDQLVLAAGALQTSAVTLGFWQSKFDYIIQDEAQDQNYAQAVIIELLAREHRNYMLVGDVNQCIYTWRGADPGKLRNFETTWAADVARMETTYRCARAITQKANVVLEALGAAPMVAASTEVGTVDIRTTPYEALGVVNGIAALKADGVPYGEIAVLYRLNAQCHAVERALVRAQVPYRVYGGASFFKLPDVVTLLAYLHLAAGSRDAQHIRPTLRAPFKYLSAQTMDSVCARAQDASCTWGAVARYADGVRGSSADKLGAWAFLIAHLEKHHAAGAPPSELLQMVLKETKYVVWAQREQEEEDDDRAEAVAALVSVAGEFATTTALFDYVTLSLNAAAQARKNAGRGGDMITLSTVHRAKGLEWDATFLVGVTYKAFPHTLGDYNEELRLLYVGVTRARKHLAVFGGVPDDEGNVSPFMRLLDPDNGESDPDNGESAAHEAFCRLVGPQSRSILSGMDPERTTCFDFLGEEPGDR